MSTNMDVAGAHSLGENSPVGNLLGENVPGEDLRVGILREKFTRWELTRGGIFRTPVANNGLITLNRNI